MQDQHSLPCTVHTFVGLIQAVASAEGTFETAHLLRGHRRKAAAAKLVRL